MKWFCLLSFFLAGCGSMLCTKGDTKQGVLFNFSTIPGDHVDIGWHPTYVLRDDWVKKLIVDEFDGFFVVTAQSTFHCDSWDKIKIEDRNMSNCKGRRFVDKHTVRRYLRKRGYEEWGSETMPKEEWQNVKNIHHSFSTKPDYFYENCRYHLLGGVYKFLQIIEKV